MNLTYRKHKFSIYQLFVRTFSNINPTNKTWGTKEENGVGKFLDITDQALKSIKELGITHIWYTGVIEHAMVGNYSTFNIPIDHPSIVKGMAGSPYAIKNYFQVHPDLAKDVAKRMDEFEDLVKRTHQQSMQVIIDFVPNHVARTYYSSGKPQGTINFGEKDNPKVHFSPQNNFYYFPNEAFEVPPHDSPTLAGVKNQYKEKPAKATGNDCFRPDPTINDWYETIKLNYGIDYMGGKGRYFSPTPSTWLIMEQILLFWASKGVDGFRCDMAEMVPAEFWQWVIPRVKERYPYVIFIAEIYQPPIYETYLKAGFDFLYDKVGLYDALRAILEKRQPAHSLSHAVYGAFERKMLRFLENHDEQRIASNFFARDMMAGVAGMVITSFAHSGPVMIYNGQEVGEPANLEEGFSKNDGRTSIFDYCSMPQMLKWVNGGKFDGAKLNEDERHLREMYRDILKLAITSEAIGEGGFYDLTYPNQHRASYDAVRLYPFIRYSRYQRLLVVVNLSAEEVSAKIVIPQHAFETCQIPHKDSYKGQDILFTDNRWWFTRQEAIEKGITIMIAPYHAYAIEIH
jgi:glycosidase